MVPKLSCIYRATAAAHCTIHPEPCCANDIQTARHLSAQGSLAVHTKNSPDTLVRASVKVRTIEGGQDTRRAQLQRLCSRFASYHMCVRPTPPAMSKPQSGPCVTRHSTKPPPEPEQYLCGLCAGVGRPTYKVHVRVTRRHAPLSGKQTKHTALEHALSQHASCCRRCVERSHSRCEVTE